MLLFPWFLAIAFAIADEFVVGKLLRREYQNDRAQWFADGKPRSIFWIPAEAKVGAWYVTYASGHAGQRARWRWLFRSPKWMSEIEDAPLLIRLHRIFLPGFWLCALAPFVIALLIQRPL